MLLNFYYKNEEKFHSKSHIIEIGFHYFTRKNQLIFNYSEIKKFISNQLIFIQNFCNFQWKEETFQAYKRVTQIYSKKYKDFNMEIDENLIATPEEKDFLRFIESSKNELTFDKMQNIEFQIQISSTINNFFDNIKIEDKDEQIKNNRLAILSTFYHLIENFAPISKLNFIQNS